MMFCLTSMTTPTQQVQVAPKTMNTHRALGIFSAFTRGARKSGNIARSLVLADHR